MKKQSSELGFSSRYVKKRSLGDYPPWQGFAVSDSLSERDYLYFSLLPPPGISIALDDLKMRDYLFSEEGGIIVPTLSLQKNDEGITFLLPHAEIQPLTKVLPSMKPADALQTLNRLSTDLLRRIKRGLVFYNLSVESLFIIDEELKLLPTAYLLPGEVLRYLQEPALRYNRSSRSLHDDLASIGEIFGVFSRYLPAGKDKTCREIAKKLRTITPETDIDDFQGIVNELGSFISDPTIEPLVLVGKETPFTLPAMAFRAVKKAAFKSREGEKNLVILHGENGSGKTRFLRSIEHKLASEWGFEKGEMLSDQYLLQNIDERDSPGEYEFVLIDDHIQEPMLIGPILDQLSQEFDHTNFAVMTVGRNSPPYIGESMAEMAKQRSITVLDVEIPELEPREKERIFMTLALDIEGDRIRKDVDFSKPCALLALDVKTMLYRMPGAADEPREDFLSALTEYERSVLTFMAVFRFEVPLSVLENIYSTETIEIFTTLQNLLAMGLITRRAESSSLCGGDLCLVYSLSSRSLAEYILQQTPATRIEQIHKNIVLILTEMKRPRQLYIYYHLAGSGETRKAALMGHELFELLLERKRQSAIIAFKEYLLGQRLDLQLPAEKRYKLLLDLGNYFALIGNIAQAENLFRRCREETSSGEGSDEFRTLAVEAVRRECEILEKKGEFLRAEKLLDKALDSHGEYLVSSERAKLYNDRAWIHYRLGQFDRSWENCLLVHKLLDEKEHPMEVAQSYNLMGAINWNRSKYDDALFCHRRCLALREACNDEIGIATSYNNLGLVNRSMGKVTEALACFRKSMLIKQRHNNLPGLAVANLNLALTHLDMEELDEAQKHCAIACQLAEDTGNQQLLAEIYGTMGEIYFLQNAFEEARNHYLQSLHICHRTQSMREKGVAFRRLGELSLAEGKIAETNELLSQAIALNQKIGSRLEQTLLNLLDARIMLAGGKREQGKRRFESASVELMLLGRKTIAATVSAEIGELYLEEENEPLAREYLGRALSLIGEGQSMPRQVRDLQGTLDRRSPLSLDHIHSDAERFKVLCRITSMIRTIRDPERLHKIVTETARKITGMKRAALILGNIGEESYRVLAAAGGFSAGGTIADENIVSILNLTRQLGYPLDLSRMQIPDDKVAPEFLEKHQSIICTPLYIQDEVTGFLYLDSPQGTGGSSDEDHSFLIAFSQQVALGLERILLSEKIGEMEQSMNAVKPTIIPAKKPFTYEDIVGHSPAMKHIYELLEGIRDMDTTVMLTGPSGVGKDLIAKAIHHTSRRRDRPFHSLNIISLTSELLESELFGHERGAFTGAHRQKIGHFESANRGTIFLNEIGDMPIGLQPKLLRVLEDQKFYRVGGTKEISTNVRIIAATNKDLPRLVKEGTFREDLYYRINIFPIRIPALSERREDIEPLCNHFLTTFCRLYNIPTKKISPEAMNYLLSYDWPGNVRELENTINRLIIISKKDTILPEDLPEQIVGRTEALHMESRADLEEIIERLIDITEFSKSDPILPKVSGMLIKKVVDKTGDKTKAAQLLGISKPTLYSKLKNNERNR